MKFAIPEISWHNRDPVLSVDIQTKSDLNDQLRLATGGTDSHVVIWYLSTTSTGSVKLEVAADLTRHQKAVNVVRWSPNGVYLASGDDESIIFIWKQKTEDLAPPSEGEEQYRETWVINKTLRGHMEDILDITWSSSSLHLASGSVDNKLIIWDVAKGRYNDIVSGHKGFIQGVAWDPKGQFIATASTDRVFRTFDVVTKKVVSRSSKALLPFPKEHPLHEVKVRLYHDDTLQTYYRRLHFSPDGLFIAVPAGKIEAEQGKLEIKPINAVYIYTRFSLKTPACVVPCGEPALVCRWSPVRWAPRSTSGSTPALPGTRLLLAVATRRSLLLYDTHQRSPIALISNIHYTRITDLTWSMDGLTLVASSTDGFCSVVSFAEGELGEKLPEPDPSTIESMETEEPQKKYEETTKMKPMEVKPIEVKRTPTQNTPKIESFMKFKTPGDKSPKNTKSEDINQKTPVKLDVLVETAMQSWSDNSSNDIIKPKENLHMDVDKNDEVMIIEDSEDIKLVYEESVGLKDNQLPKTASPENARSKASPKQSDNPSNIFLKQAKVTDIKEPLAVKAVASPKAPRRVSFVTLSSPKSTKKK